jgi:ketosteroid isomerase-like protein
MRHSATVVVITISLLLSFSVPAVFGQDRAATAQLEIENVLHQQVEAWNRHDLEAFMAGYWNSPDLIFFSGALKTSGWQSTLERYRARYQSEGREMGKLEFSDLSIHQLAPDAAYVLGEFHLTMSDGSTPHGLFTLIFRKFSDGWKIVHDHTSAAP